MERVVDTLDPVHRDYLERMLDRNVLYWHNRDEWDLMFQYEILDRGLVQIDGVEHKALLELLEEHRAR